MDMTFAIDAAFLPATLTCHPMSDEAFAALCAEHPDFMLEMTAAGDLIVLAPTNSDTGASNMNIAVQLGSWALRDGRGIACDSSTGFVVPNGSRRSPDASWTLKPRVQALGNAKRASFWHLCPDFVIEVRSSSDRRKHLETKMQEYLSQGAQLGWLIDPESQSVTIYRSNGELESRTGIHEILGEGPIEGFHLDLKLVWDPFA
jgi:Uma2 family endonuclease